jgi:peptide/nickel transport system ATP-binding protein
MTLITINDLSVVFHGGEIVKAVDDVSFSVNRNEILALVGETGCGKSVIAHSIMRLLPPEAVVTGNVTFEGNNIFDLSEAEMSSIRGNRISIIFQNPSLSLNPVHKTGIQVAEPLKIHRKTKKDLALEKAASALKKSGFARPDLNMNLYPGECSGGMNQRSLIAASIITEPSLIIADEPTKGLDANLISHVEKNLLSISREKKISVLLITHDLGVARNLADRIAIMYAGEIVEIVHADQFFDKPLHPYSLGLIRSLPENGFIPIDGESASMAEQVSGCRFSPRCPHSTFRCTDEHPPLYKRGNRKVRCFLYC